MRSHVLAVLSGLTLVLMHGGTLAQTSGNATSGAKAMQDVKPPNFARLFQKPTNNNGYEEWVEAADLIQNNADVDAATQPGATLTFKRHLLANPSVARALQLIRAGLDKPVRSPRTSLDENTLLPELGPFRKLARLLRTEQYVDFAEGRVVSAIDSLRIGLAFGYRIQTDTIISGLVGIAIDSMLLDEFAHHIDQLSAGQCDEVMRLMGAFLHAENSVARLLAQEKGMEIKMLEARRSDPNSLLKLLDMAVGTDNTREAANLQSLQERLASQPEDLNSIIDDAEARINALYAQAQLNLRLPLARRLPLVTDTSSSPGAFLARSVAPDIQRVIERYNGDQAKLRLLGIHVLIRRYRWENNALPNSLRELHADDLVTDPFTGDQIAYQRDKDRYTLYSQGPVKRDENGQPVGNERVPVKL